MRDPDASISFEIDRVVRRLAEPLPDGHFLRSAQARRWIGDGLLVPFEIENDRRVSAERLAFVTQPSEWCDSQLHDAARLTLDLQQQCVADGFDLKDASAWNVLFDGTQPMFCDLLSFVALRERKWWAAGQFTRHFIVPLAVARRRGLHAHETFRVWRDGMPPEVARRLLGPSRFVSRFWPLVAGGSTQDAAVETPPAALPDDVAAFRRGLHGSLLWMLHGARPAIDATGSDAGWHRYADRRDHYHDTGLDAKRSQVGQWLACVEPDWVADLGCNTGEFSRVALEAGAQVVAIDADHDSVQTLYRGHPPSRKLFPVIASLDDLSGGRGWGGCEHPGLAQRLEARFDLVLMLALIHHLAVGAAVPLLQVAEFVKRCTRQWAIVEWIDENDPQLKRLCVQRRRETAEFGLQRQRQAFVEAGFIVEAECSLHPAARTLALLRRPA